MKKVSEHQKEVFVPRKRFYVEREALVVDIGNETEQRFFLAMSADEHINLIRDLQESLLRRSMYDGFMRRSSNEHH